MFAFSKVVGWLLNPVSLAIILIVLSVVAAIFRFRKTGILFGIGTALWLIIVLYSPLATWLIRPLEQQFEKVEIGGDFSGIIVIGGGIESDISASLNHIEFAAGADRLIQGIVLAKKFPDVKVIYTSGTGRLEEDAMRSADIAGDFILQNGIDKSRIILERNSRNTFENVEFTKKILGREATNGKYVVITSAFHMPRTIGIFRAQGVKVIPYPVDYRTINNDKLVDPSRSPMDNFVNMSIALREWSGLVSYYLIGRTRQIFPGKDP